MNKQLLKFIFEQSGAECQLQDNMLLVNLVLKGNIRDIKPVFIAEIYKDDIDISDKDVLKKLLGYEEGLRSYEKHYMCTCASQYGYPSEDFYEKMEMMDDSLITVKNEFSEFELKFQLFYKVFSNIQ